LDPGRKVSVLSFKGVERRGSGGERGGGDEAVAWQTRGKTLYFLMDGRIRHVLLNISLFFLHLLHAFASPVFIPECSNVSLLWLI
jgi:hypothetical protein